MKKVFIAVLAIILLYAGGVWAKFYIGGDANFPYVDHVGFGRFEEDYVGPPEKKAPSDYITYEGKDGQTALSLLYVGNYVATAEGGFVTEINGRKADLDKKEFWAFYVNEEMAQVGAADYMTKNGDKIEWKIETY
ncbi:DUF4430 domain-containing protein [Candidatus Microgenomates bacterium]|nr:DUF4430 domain-containing protein [Candidatus Microgenomates bacterium]